jgi:hypothetical protein
MEEHVEMEEAQEEVDVEVEKKPSKREKLDKKRKIEEYLDQHLPLNVLGLSSSLTIET